MDPPNTHQKLVFSGFNHSNADNNSVNHLITMHSTLKASYLPTYPRRNLPKYPKTDVSREDILNNADGQTTY